MWFYWESKVNKRQGVTENSKHAQLTFPRYRKVKIMIIKKLPHPARFSLSRYHSPCALHRLWALAMFIF